VGQSKRLAKVQRLIDAGMPNSALAVADLEGVQFTKPTLNRWLREAQGPRATYAWLALQPTEAKP
jgi:hypothetical protein